MTKFIKVEVKERIPKESGEYFTNVGLINFHINSNNFYDEISGEKEYPIYWLEEIEDNESALIKRNEELEEMLKTVYNNIDFESDLEKYHKDYILKLLTKNYIFRMYA